MKTNLKKNQPQRRILVVIAHDDDAILGVGGKIVRHLASGDRVRVAVVTDGKYSHKAVLGIEQNPTAWELSKAREREMAEAMRILGLLREDLSFLRLADGQGRAWQDDDQAKRRIRDFFDGQAFHSVYFHYPDAHFDHKAVSKIVLEILASLRPRPEAYQFFIWTQELAAGRADVDASQVPAISASAIRHRLSPEELELKREALFAMTSQVSTWPYAHWQCQEKPILDSRFVNHFLGGEEIFVRADLSA